MDSAVEWSEICKIWLCVPKMRIREEKKDMERHVSKTTQKTQISWQYLLWKIQSIWMGLSILNTPTGMKEDSADSRWHSTFMVYVPVHVILRFKSWWPWLVSVYMYDMPEGHFFFPEKRGSSLLLCITWVHLKPYMAQSLSNVAFKETVLWQKNIIDSKSHLYSASWKKKCQRGEYILNASKA